MESETIRRIDGQEMAVRDADAVPPSTWRERYWQFLIASGLSKTSLRVLDIDSDYIVNAGIFGAGRPTGNASTWPSSRLRRGLTMGSVQSGKTASLLAVTAKCLDQGLNIAVILGGTRLALWRQTFDRVSHQLDQWNQSNDSQRRETRIALPPPQFLEESQDLPDLRAMYFETPNLVRRLLLEGKPLVAVVMKHSDHLMTFSQYLHDVLSAVFVRTSRPVHLLVIDDEADDGSILDKDVEAGMGLDSEGLKQIPRHVARLWSASGPQHETFHEKLFATYLAYTATPHANFLQSDHNPLSPTDFIAALRTPFNVGSVDPPRNTTYEEPLGVRKYYIGGESFYRMLNSPPSESCVTTKYPDEKRCPSRAAFEKQVQERREELLSHALRAYFVAGAIRLHLSTRRLAGARAAAAGPIEEIRKISPEPHSMLYHPSSRIEDHFQSAEEVVRWCSQFSSEDKRIRGADLAVSETAGLMLNAEGLTTRLLAEEHLWKQWVDEYEQTRLKVSYLPGGQDYQLVDPTVWSVIREILVNDIFPHTRLVVINSDPRADDRPQFDPTPVGDNKFVVARDLHTIFISGNVMARGVTLEGLTTSLFLRSADEPAADAQMQMQRWFGYRGNTLCWCRLFLFEDQLQLFRAYHEADEALRQDIIEEMNRNPGTAPSPTVLQGPRFKATSKIANLRALPLCPGADPFVRVLETGAHAVGNTNVLANLLDEGELSDVVVGGRKRGIVLNRQLGLADVAELLEKFRYSNHKPVPTAENHLRWRSLANQLSLGEAEAPLFRPPTRSGESIEAVSPQYCPYSIAAYLRLWKAALSRRVRGLYPTDNSTTPWSMINLTDYLRSAPVFYVGVRFGAAGGSTNQRLAEHGIQAMIRDSRRGILRSTWGSRNPSERDDAYLGDQLFDYHVHESPRPKQVPGEPLWRPRGAPGLLLFHVIRAEDGGPDAIAAGLAIPLGGPDHIAALRANRTS